MSALRYALVLGFMSAMTLAKPPNLDNYKRCGLNGAAKGGCGADLNRHKNRYTSPASDEIKPEIVLAAILKEGDDVDRWSVDDGASVTGYVASVEPGGAQESCNCKRDDLQDIHINIVLDPSDVGNAERYFVSEITPRMQGLHPTWTYSKIKKRIEGKWVRFTGWMFFDGMHSRESFNTKDRPKQECGTLKVNEIWRATAWEIHPLTDFAIVEAPQQ